MKKIVSDDCAMDLATFCKRATFDDAYNRSHGETEEERESMAYRVLRALGEVQAYLNDLGFSPR